jgi:DNA recombination protein RmuC
MFLPVEGLYAEAVKHGLVEKLQQKYKVNIAGPTTMAALLNSLQMGFKTLQIQKQSSEVWRILQSTKQEFEKYASVLNKTQERLKQAQDELETLVGVRTRQISAKLSNIDQYKPDELPPA